MTRTDDLIRDIKEMTAQWRAEVPGGRKAWPRSIKERVRELYALGMGSSAIANATGLTYYTIHNWKKRNSEFLALSIAKPATVTVKESEPIATVTVTTANGLKIEGISFEQAVIIAEKLR